MKVLIVEDDESGRENLADILELDGHQVYGAATGQAALEICETTQFDSLILDWKLPDQSADVLIPKLRKVQPDKPIIVVTGYGDVELVVLAMRSGVYDYLEKPINPTVLQATLSRVAERQHNLEQLELVQHKLVSSARLAAIGQMVAGLAHESRNAFQRSQACLEMLELNLADDPENLQIIAKIQKALEELEKLYDEVREYASPIVLAKDRVNIISLLNESWKLLQSVDQAPLARLTIEAAPGMEKILCTLDLHRMHQVFRNLLENAAFASLSAQPQSAQPPVANVHAKIYQHDQRVRIEISDDGPGIPVDQREAVFEPFFTTKTKGTGLGLAISRRVVEKHGGELNVIDSENGACFQIQLRLRD